MKEYKKLVSILTNAGYDMSKIKKEDMGNFIIRRLKHLLILQVNLEFKEFLYKHTSFLPENTVPRDRWAYYEQGLTEIKKCPDCSIVEYDNKRSLFKHSCGYEFEATNYLLLKGKHHCICQHTKIVKHTLVTIRKKFKDSDWYPVKLLKNKRVLCKNKICGHKQILIHDTMSIKCNTCNPNKYATNIITYEDYVEKLKKDLSLR